MQIDNPLSVSLSVCLQSCIESDKDCHFLSQENFLNVLKNIFENLVSIFQELHLRTFFFFLSTIFILIFFHTQHNRISKIKQNKTADTYSTSQGSIKREGEREGQQEHKSHSFK